MQHRPQASMKQYVGYLHQQMVQASRIPMETVGPCSDRTKTLSERTEITEVLRSLEISRSRQF